MRILNGQSMNRTPDFDPNSGVPYHPVSPESGSDGCLLLRGLQNDKSIFDVVTVRFALAQSMGRLRWVGPSCATLQSID